MKNILNFNQTFAFILIASTLTACSVMRSYKAEDPNWTEDFFRDAKNSPGQQLLRQNRCNDAIPILVEEAEGFGPVQIYSDITLTTMYFYHVEGCPWPDERILEHFKKSGTNRSKVTLSLIYKNGIGVNRDIKEAISVLDGMDFEYAKNYLPTQVQDAQKQLEEIYSQIGRQ